MVLKLWGGEETCVTKDGWSKVDFINKRKITIETLTVCFKKYI